MVAVTQFVVAGVLAVAVQALPQMPTYSTARSATARFQKLLTQGGMGKTLLTGPALEKQIVFPFTPKASTNATTPKGGVAVAANVDTFPILNGLGISTTLGFMQPCGINTPHVHPRATEFLTLVSNTNLKFGYVLENGLVAAGQNPEIAGTLKQYEGTVFPQGSIHFQFNDGCKPAVFVAGLNSEDPGTNQIAQGFFALNSGVVNATLGFPKEINGKNIEQFRKMIPANFAQDVDRCLAKCNTKPTPSGKPTPTNKPTSIVKPTSTSKPVSSVKPSSTIKPSSTVQPTTVVKTTTTIMTTTTVKPSSVVNPTPIGVPTPIGY